MKKFKQPAPPYLLILLFLFKWEASYSQIKEFTAKNIDQRYARNSQPSATSLNKYFKKYSVFLLETNEIALYTKSTFAASFILNLASERLKLKVEPNDMRGKNFKAVAITAKGQEELIQTVTNNYKGFANDDSSNVVRLNIDKSTFEGYINVGKRRLYIDKLSRFEPNESSDKIVVYDGADVIPDATKKCGSEMLADQKKQFDQNNSYNSMALTGNCHFLEIATEADFEYYNAFSRNADEALNRIRAVLNLVEGLYTPTFNIKFILNFQQIWATANDPYAGDSLQLILPQFVTWWRGNRSYVSRDETHLFSGRALLNGTVGLAYINAVCDTSRYYSCVANYSPVTNATISLSAHEIGHNFGAGHDLTCNGSNIMCPFIQAGVPHWSAQSIAQISNRANSFFGSCMTESFPENINYAGIGVQNYLKLIAANDITINSSISAVRLSSTGFGHFEAGRRMVFTPTKANSMGLFAPRGSTLLMRISDVVNSCDPLTVTRSGVPPQNKKSLSPLIAESIQARINPNPFRTSVEVTLNLEQNESGKLVIYNLLGIKVKEKPGIKLLKGFNKISFYCPSLLPGIYMLEIDLGHYKRVEKIVKI